MARFEWDETKSKANQRKHGVLFQDAVSVFFDERAIAIFDEAGNDEDRYIAIGTDALARILVVVYAVRGDTIRIISARRANQRERREYED